MTLYKEKDGSYTRVVNGKSYKVTPNDSRYNAIANEYNAQSGSSGGSSSGSSGSSGGSSSGSSSSSSYDDILADQIRDQIAASRNDTSSTNNQPTAAGVGIITLGNNGDLIRVVDGKSYVVSKNDPRYGAITQEYYDQQRQNGTPSPYDNYSTAVSNGIYPGAAGSGGMSQISQNNALASSEPTGVSNGIYPGAAGSGDALAPSEPTGYDAYEAIIKESLQAQQDANKAALEAVLGKLQAGIDNTNTAYDEMARNAYIAMMMNRRDMPQRIAALGLSGTGTSESIAQQNTMNYQNALNANEVQRLAAMRDFYDLMANYTTQTGVTNAQLQAAAGQDMANVYLQLYLQDQARQQELADRDWTLQQQQAQQALALQQQQEAYAREDLANRIDVLLALGLTTKDMADYFGVSEAVLQQALRSYQA